MGRIIIKKPNTKYKVGDRLKINDIDLVVVKGKCDNCYFSWTSEDNQKRCKASFKEGCTSNLGFDLICMKLEKGL